MTLNPVHVNPYYNPSKSCFFSKILAPDPHKLMIINLIRKIDKARDKGSLSAVFSNPACGERAEPLGISLPFDSLMAGSSSALRVQYGRVISHAIIRVYSCPLTQRVISLRSSRWFPYFRLLIAAPPFPARVTSRILISAGLTPLMREAWPRV